MGHWVNGVCDVCGKTRSVEVMSYTEPDGTSDQVAVCFICQKETERKSRKDEAEYMAQYKEEPDPGYDPDEVEDAWDDAARRYGNENGNAE